MKRLQMTVTLACLLVLSGSFLSPARAVDLRPLFTSPETDGVEGNSFDGVNFYASGAGAPFMVDTTAIWEGNNVAVFTMDGFSANDGAGFSISISNGENGKDSSEGGANTDIPNTTPVNPAIAALNDSGKLENGNVIRLSAWMRQDPNDPVTIVPQLEPVMKIELWKEALSGNADFNGALFPSFGDRIWDTDQNGGQIDHQVNGQSQASWVDMNNSGSTSFGLPVSQSLVPDEWRLVETTLVVDDNPLDDAFGWGIGEEGFTVADVEEIRGIVYLGDFAGTNLTDAGSVWIDNLLIEIFEDEAALNANPNSNPMPIPEAMIMPGDTNGDGAVNFGDLAGFAQVLTDPDGYEAAFPGLAPDSCDMNGDNACNFGDLAGFSALLTGGGAAAGSANAIPEPTTLLMLLLGSSLGFVARNRATR